MANNGRLLAWLRRSPREEESSREEPGYVRTVPYDGNKYIDPNEFIKDKKVREQVKRLAEEANSRQLQSRQS